MFISNYHTFRRAHHLAWNPWRPTLSCATRNNAALRWYFYSRLNTAYFALFLNWPIILLRLFDSCFNLF